MTRTKSNRINRTAVLVLGLAVMSVLLLLGLSWQRIVTEYHLSKLRSDPAHAWTLTAPDRSPAAEAALAKFFKTQPGKKWLAERFFAHVFGPHLESVVLIRKRDLTLLFITPGHSLQAYSKNSNGTASAHSLSLPYNQSTFKTFKTIALIRGLPFEEPIRQQVGQWELQIEQATKEGLESIQFNKQIGVSIGPYKGLTHFCIVRPVEALERE